MSDTANLRSLLERCKAATGPDRELDLEIHWHLDCAGGPQSADFRAMQEGTDGRA